MTRPLASETQKVTFPQNVNAVIRKMYVRTYVP
jgi:hypothetical protein